MAWTCNGNSSTKVLVTGPAYSIAEVGEELAWLNAALNNSPVDQGIISLHPVCEVNRVNRGVLAQGTHTIQIKRCKLSYSMGLILPVPPLESSAGKCWMGLFRNPALVRGYPVPQRAIPKTGIEMPLDMMAELVNTRKITTFDGRIYLKGFSTLLTPTKRHKDTIFWHMTFNKTGSYIPYSDSRAKELAKQYPPGLSTRDLESCRHIVGWCANVENVTGRNCPGLSVLSDDYLLLLGTRNANYNIRWSGLSPPRPGCAFEKVSIVGGTFVTAGVSCILGKKDKAVHMRSRDDYTMRLKWVSKKFVVLYDVERKTAWLVDGVSALLHLVRASLKHDQEDAFNSLFLFDESAMEEPPRSHKAKAASIYVLTSRKNMSLPIYAKPDNDKEEVTTDEIGTRSRIVSTTKTNYCLRDRIESICDVLEQIMAHQADVSSEDGVGFRIRYTMRRQLEGFDFMDVATDEDPFWPRVTTLKASGRGWVDFTRAIHAITLFGKGFGDLIRPSNGTTACGNCQHNADIPKGEDYLAVSVPIIHEIMQKRGSQETNPWRLADDIYWYTPDQIVESCRCTGLPPTRRDRVQVLLPSSFPKLWMTRRATTPIPSFPKTGALIFGHSWKFPLRWKDRGDPEEGQPTQDMDEMEESFQDSGMGTSLEGSSTSAVEGDSPCSSYSGSRAPKRNALFTPDLYQDTKSPVTKRRLLPQTSSSESHQPTTACDNAENKSNTEKSNQLQFPDFIRKWRPAGR